MFGLVETIVGSVGKVLDKFVVDANTKAKIEQELQMLSITWAQMDANDRDSARKREMATNDTTTRELAWVYTGGYFAMVICLIMGWVNIPPAHDKLLDVLMGVLTAGQYSVLTFYFGSSHGSAMKDTTIDRVVNHR